MPNAAASPPTAPTSFPGPFGPLGSRGVPGSPEPKPLPPCPADMSPPSQPRPRTRSVGLQVRLGARTLQERAPLWTTLTTGQAPLPRSVS
ncbi:uncharacterized protein LOC113212340 [Frankliniella occidentalis]|uniref:Uncharacterized protein LOC113212340 n=1 Tax=Frankliniella occidentalis TaxID=133901 RepID=A0A9C6XAL6_FRAOC|nr:uncharacterized protein LOC113212340 [Frankliniella occidentalis]